MLRILDKPFRINKLFSNWRWLLMKNFLKKRDWNWVRGKSFFTLSLFFHPLNNETFNFVLLYCSIVWIVENALAFFPWNMHGLALENTRVPYLFASSKQLHYYCNYNLAIYIENTLVWRVNGIINKLKVQLF